MVRDNLQPDGSLDGDKFARALLIHRNTPDPATGVSPAQIVFGRPIRDHLPTPLHKLDIRSDWTKAAKLREECFMKRHYAKCEDLTHGTKQLQSLIPGDFVYVQDQAGKTPRQWNRSAKVLEALPHDSFLIRIDGSYTTTRRNRKFLRKFTPHNEVLPPTTYNPTHTTIPLPQEPEIPHIPQADLQNQDVVDEDQHTPQELPMQQQLDEPAQHDPHSPLTAMPSDHVQPATQHDNSQSESVKTKQKPKHLREKWIVASPKPSTNICENAPQMDQITAAARTFVQACLEVLHLNLSDASIGRGGIART